MKYGKKSPEIFDFCNRVRTIAVLLVFAMLMTMIGPLQILAKEEKLQLYSKAAVLMDAETGRVLYGKNEKEVLPMASTTKILTCILALEYADPYMEVIASEQAVNMPKVKLNMHKGERFYLNDLLYSLMLESHNDSAVAIAEAVAGSVEDFAGMMNRKAKDIGCYDSYFITPNGLDAERTEDGRKHATTATDLAKIMAYCVTKSPAKDLFLKITGTNAYRFMDLDKRYSYSCVNHNAFLSMRQEALSGKTGFTNQAGYCYVGAIESDGRTFTIALLACGWPNHRNYKWSDMKTLTDYGMRNYRSANLYRKIKLKPIAVNKGVANSVFEKAYTEVKIQNESETLLYLLGADDRVSVKTELPKQVDAPLKKGMQVGTVSYYLNGMLIAQYPIITAKQVDKITYEHYIRYVFMRMRPCNLVKMFSK